MIPISRRRLLAASAASAGAALAGCLGSDDETQDDPEDPPEEADADDEPATPTLYGVDIENRHDQPHSAHVLVERSGEIVHWSSVDLDPDETGSVERNWDVDPGAYVVSVRIDDDQSWKQVDLTEENSICYAVVPRITSEGDLRILWEKNPDGCN